MRCTLNKQKTPRLTCKVWLTLDFNKKRLAPFFQNFYFWRDFSFLSLPIFFGRKRNKKKNLNNNGSPLPCNFTFKKSKIALGETETKMKNLLKWKIWNLGVRLLWNVKCFLTKCVVKICFFEISVCNLLFDEKKLIRRNQNHSLTKHLHRLEKILHLRSWHQNRVRFGTEAVWNVKSHLKLPYTWQRVPTKEKSFLQKFLPFLSACRGESLNIKTEHVFFLSLSPRIFQKILRQSETACFFHFFTIGRKRFFDGSGHWDSNLTHTDFPWILRNLDRQTLILPWMHRAFLFFFTLGKNFQQLTKTLSCFLRKTFHNALENFAWTLCCLLWERDQI